MASVCDSASRIVSQTLQSGAIRNSYYDQNDQILDLLDVNGAGANITAWTFSYDSVGNRASVQDLLGNLTTYSMDAKDRLVQDDTTGPNAHIYNYTYDSTDNRLTANETGFVTTWAYDLASRMQTGTSSAGTSTYTYSANGNLTGVNEASGLTTMAYDWENRLQFSEASGTTASYLYYTDNMKAVENVGGVLTTLIWDGSDYLQGRS